jgi:hypothetical protein
VKDSSQHSLPMDLQADHAWTMSNDTARPRCRRGSVDARPPDPAASTSSLCRRA